MQQSMADQMQIVRREIAEERKAREEREGEVEGGKGKYDKENKKAGMDE